MAVEGYTLAVTLQSPTAVPLGGAQAGALFQQLLVLSSAVLEQHNQEMHSWTMRT